MSKRTRHVEPNTKLIASEIHDVEARRFRTLLVRLGIHIVGKSWLPKAPIRMRINDIDTTWCKGSENGDPGLPGNVGIFDLGNFNQNKRLKVPMRTIIREAVAFQGEV